MNDLVKVVYIGDKAVKPDNVLKTRRVWRGRGSVVSVPRAEAEIYFSYEDIWASEEAAGAIINAKTVDLEGVEAAPTPKAKKAAKAAVKIDESERGMLIQGAILQLDPEKGEHYTEQGKPRLKAVVETVGFSVEAKEIESALKDLRAAGKLPEPESAK